MQRLGHRSSIWREHEANALTPRCVGHFCYATDKPFRVGPRVDHSIIAVIDADRVLGIACAGRVGEQQHLPCDTQQTG